MGYDSWYIRNGIHEITGVDDLQGLMLRSPGYWGVVGQAVGMVPSYIAWYEAYEALQKGMLDVQVTGRTNPAANFYYEVCDRTISLEESIPGSGNTSIYMNLDLWNSFPDYVKDIWWETLAEVHEYVYRTYKHQVAYGEEFLQSKGVTRILFSDADNQRLIEGAGAAYESWLNDATGLKGSEASNWYKEIVTAREASTGKTWMYKPW